MIIKSKRTRARGPALRRLIKHVTDGDDNESTELLQGNLAEPEDARADALRFAREFCVRSFVVSPERVLTIEQWLWLLALLGQEFGFNPLEAVVWRHRKARASGADSENSEHYHVLVREVDAVSGRVLSNSHSFARHEKISRIAELHFGKGHSLTSGAHNRAVASFLAGGEHDLVASAMAKAGLLDAERPMESFNEAAQQQAKRKGLDLPRLRVLISDALAASSNRDQFDKKLVAIGLRVRPGEKLDTPIVETLDGETVGSLARLTRLRKAALQQRMKFNGTVPAAYVAQIPEQRGQEAARPSLADSRVAPLVDNQAEAGGDVGRPGDGDRSTGPDGHDDPPTSEFDARRRADPEQAGGPGICSEPDRAAERREPGRSDLIVALGCADKHNALLDLLGIARRSALGPLDRVVDELDTLIEKNSAIIGRPVRLSEPLSLVAAREAANGSKERHTKLAADENDTSLELAALPKATLWRRFWYRREAKLRSRLTASLDRRRASTAAAERVVTKAQTTLIDEMSRHQKALTIRTMEAEAASKAAELALPVLKAAKTLVTDNPHLAVQGASRVIGMASKLHNLTLVDDQDHEDRHAFRI